MGKCTREELVRGVTNEACQSTIDLMNAERGYSNEYNLYDECYDVVDITLPSWKLADMRSGGRWSMDGTPCGGESALLTWIQHPRVKRALHIDSDARYVDGESAEGFVYHTTEGSIAPIYKMLADSTALRVLLYIGDADPGLNVHRGENFTRSLNLSEREAWRPWTQDGRMHMGGYVTRFMGDLDFLTIRGAGHLVPRFKPAAALAFLRSWLAGEDYPYLQRKGLV